MKKKTYKTPTLKEKVKMYEDFLHRINISVMCCDDLAVQELVYNADMWSYMHRCGNGEPSDKEQQRLINSRFWKLLDTPKADAAREERQKKYSEAKAAREEKEKYKSAEDLIKDFENMKIVL